MRLLLNIDVPDLAAAERFYVDAFGLRRGRRLGDTALELLGAEAPVYLLQQPAGSWWRTQHLGLYLLVNIGLSVLFADVVHRWVERPAMALGKRVAARYERHATMRPSRRGGAGIAPSLD